MNTGAQSQFTLVAPCPPDAVSIMGKWVCTELGDVFDDSTRPISPGEFSNMFRGSERAGLQSIAVVSGGELSGVILAKQLPLGVVELGWLAPLRSMGTMLRAAREVITGLFEAGCSRVQFRFRSTDRAFVRTMESLGGEHGEVVETAFFSGRPATIMLGSIERERFAKLQAGVERENANAACLCC